MPGFRIVEHFYSRKSQALFLALWFVGVKRSEEEFIINQMYQASLSSLSVVIERAIKEVPPVEVGKFLSVIRKCSIFLGLLLMQSPTPEQLSEYCAELQEHIRLQCPNLDVDDLDVGELAANINFDMDLRRIMHPHVEAIETSLLPINSTEARWRSIAFNNVITQKVFRALMIGLQTVFRNEYTLWQFLQVSRGFRHEENRRGCMPDPEILVIQTNNPDQNDQEGDLHPTGERIPLEKFCVPAESVAVDSTCSICVSEVNCAAIESHEKFTGKLTLRVVNRDKGFVDATTFKIMEPDEKPVVTACGHYFHEMCLDMWVNDSGMRTASLCPSCRTEMCEGRPRVPATLLEEMEDAYIDVISEEYQNTITMEMAEVINEDLSDNTR